MALRDIIMTDDDLIREGQLAELRRELQNAYERIEDLETAMRGLIWLVEVVAHSPEIPPHVRESIEVNPKLLDAKELLK